MIDLRNCKAGDMLLTSQGTIVEYISPTPWKNYTYLDHVVRYVTKSNGEPYERDDNYGTRTHDGYVYKNKRMPDVDHDIVRVLEVNEDGSVII